MAVRPLDVSEPLLLEMINKAIGNEVFSAEFLQGLTRVLAAYASYQLSDGRKD